MMASLDEIGTALDKTLENVNYLYQDQVTPEMHAAVDEHYEKMGELYNAMIAYYASHGMTAEDQKIIASVQKSMDRIDRTDFGNMRSKRKLNELTAPSD